MSGWMRTKFLLAVSLVTMITTTAHAEFETKTGWNDQLFPSFIISTATIKLPEEAVEDYENETVLGDRQGLLGVTIEAEEDDTSVTVTVSCDAIMEPSVFTGTLASAGTTYTILPKIKFKYDALARQTQPGPVTVTFKVEIGDDDEEEVSKTLTLRSINDCPFTIVEDEESIDVSFMFAAYVNEQHPYVDKVLREALNTGIVDSFTGYQSGDKAEVFRQAYALWHALSQRDLKYSSITTTSAESDSVNSQHVRLIDESINNAQANCVDGSVLLASLLRKVGIEPVLVMVPGHCYLGFYLDAKQTEIAGLETTLIGSTADDDDTPSIEGVDIDEKWQSENSWSTFVSAIALGNNNLKENAENFEKKEDPDYQIISVYAARKIGILPIAFKSGSEFVASTAAKDRTPAKKIDDDDEEEDDEEAPTK